MQEYKMKLILPNNETEEITALEGTTYWEIAKKVKHKYDEQIMLVMHNSKLRELNKKIKKSGTLSFLTATHKDAKRTYRRTATIIMQKAVYNLWGKQANVKVYCSLGDGYYCEILDKKITGEDVARIKEEMRRLVEADMPIDKMSAKTDAAEQLFAKMGMHEKERLFHYRRSSRVNLYSFDGMYDYYYGFMLPSSGYIRHFDVQPYDEGFVLMFPGKEEAVVSQLQDTPKLFQTLKESKQWSKKLSISSIGALNDAITQGRGENLILLQEALMEERIAHLAEKIAQNKNVKFVMIAGPSSSGKTTFSNRLAIQLAGKGIQPHPIGLDDYYIDRAKCPRDENGKLDFECLESIDVELFNEDMNRLLRGEEVEIPSFNFKTGSREYRGRKLQLGKDDILVIEGIHGLNNKLSHSIPDENKFKVYISALTQLNIDEHNPLSTTDGRLLRRIVRDARTRGTTAQETIAMWPSVRRGEERYIFPNQETADVMFNSALVYELAVLKVYAEPLLFQIPAGSEEYLEAKRLLKFLDYLLPLPTEGISQNSLIREFIGGSCFHV